jgi:integrase
VKLPAFPLILAKGNSRITIYRQDSTKRRKGESFLVAFYEGSKRRLRAFASYPAARAAADRITGSVNEGDVQALVLNAGQKAAYLRAVDALRPAGLPLDVAAIQLADALARLQGRFLSEAVSYFTARMLTVKRKPVAEVVAEFLAEKEKRTKRGSLASARYLGDLRKQLTAFATAFQCELADVTPEQIRLWADGHEWGARTRFNSLSQIKTLFLFARARGYYAREEDALAGVQFAKGKGGEIGIFTPAEMRWLLAVAKPEIVPFLAIGAFAGLRTAEITRLDWSKVNLAKRFIEVTAQSAKTASRRIVPMADNLARMACALREDRRPSVRPSATGEAFRRGDGARGEARLEAQRLAALVHLLPRRRHEEHGERGFGSGQFARNGVQPLPRVGPRRSGGGVVRHHAHCTGDGERRADGSVIQIRNLPTSFADIGCPFSAGHSPGYAQQPHLQGYKPLKARHAVPSPSRRELLPLAGAAISRVHVGSPQEITMSSHADKMLTDEIVPASATRWSPASWC